MDTTLIDKLQTAWSLAARYHGDQRYKTPQEGITVPYLTHLGAVLLEAQEAYRRRPDISADLLLLCAVLHDVLEDTAMPAAVIADHFGRAVLHGVQALTKVEQLPGKTAQMADSLRRIKSQPPEVAMVKLCDRICNLQPPPASWEEDYVRAYRDEAELILRELGCADGYLAGRLAQKIAVYGR